MASDANHRRSKFAALSAHVDGFKCETKSEPRNPLKIQQAKEQQSTPRSEYTPTSSSSLNVLRNRWEVSSSTGTPLHPSKNNDELLNAAIRAIEHNSTPQIVRKMSALSSLGSSQKSTRRALRMSPETSSISYFDESIQSGTSQQNCLSLNSPLFEKLQISPQSISKKFASSPQLDPFSTPSLKSVNALNRKISNLTARKTNGKTNETKEGVISGALESRIIQQACAANKTTAMLEADGENLTQLTEIPKKKRSMSEEVENFGSLLDDINRDLEKYLPQRDVQSDIIGRGQGSKLFHTISFYRRQTSEAKQYQMPADKAESSTSYTMETSSCSEISPPHILESAEEVESKLKRLGDTLIVQQDHISQATRALLFCRQNDNFRGSREEADALKALLVASERREALLLEKECILNGDLAVSGPLELVICSKISAKLSRDYINLYVRQYSDCSLYYFVALIKSHENVFCTPMVTSREAVKSGYVQFSREIRVPVPAFNFILVIEIYALKLSSEQANKGKAKKKRISRKSFGLPFDMHASDRSIANFSSSNHKNMVENGFQKAGYLLLDKSKIEKKQFHLIDAADPLDGNLALDIRCIS
ncbi:cell division protein anillin domain-containing protein [Ditylenchus destructor]|uniref:Cell division protein anillin domain-containing protein n=1 Tax=Ditylenchus destructor TaxID=166010 RepID=A0AAD4NEY3_9BILA|nr:cell division protein anillin domain-containing protein [Ditylenchus destructor]